MASGKRDRSRSATGPTGERLPGRVADAILAAVAAAPPHVLLPAGFLLFFALSVGAVIEDSATFDEGVYLASGTSYLRTGDFRMNAEQPVLLKLYAALPLLFQNPRLPLESSAWAGADEWTFGFQFMYQSGNSPGAMLVASRLACLVWGLLLSGAVYAVARDRFGPLGGAVAFLLAVSCPTLLGHARYATMDVMVAALIFLTVVAVERWADRPTAWRAIQAGILLGGALLAKFSALLLCLTLPVVGILIWRRRSAEGHEEGTASPSMEKERRLWTLGLLAGTAYGLLWAAYQFQGSRSPALPPSYWDLDAAPRTPIISLVLGLRYLHVLPETYLLGIVNQSRHDDTGHEAYALGLCSKSGWWWYFPLAFLLKTPLTSLAMFAWGTGSAVRRILLSDRSLLAWLVVPVTFGAVSLGVNLNLGIRYLLPILPFLMVLSGGVAGLREPTGTRGPSKRIVLALLLVGLLDAAFTAPYQLAYFNWGARLLGKPHELLVDSNLDWGQDLGRLKAYMDRERIDELKLSYFGAASPLQLDLRHRQLPGFNLYGPREEPWPIGTPVEPGDLVAVSATNLAGAYMNDPTFYRRLLGNLRPEAVIGSSIYLYRIPPAR